MGSWLLYGLGAETENLPGFVVMVSRSERPGPTDLRAPVVVRFPALANSRACNSSRKGNAVHYIGNPDGVCQSTQRQVIEEVQRLNGLLRGEHVDPEIETRIAQYEMAFRMQIVGARTHRHARRAASTCSTSTASSKPGDGSFASNCLLARRMLERGVRFIQLYHRGWDHHGDIEKDMPDVRQAHRPGLRRARQGPQTARHARRHARHLGRRIRPHADGPGHRTRPPHQRLQHLDGRRGHQAGHRPRQHRRTRLRRRRKTSSTSAISTPRCSTCSASTTRVSPPSSKASTTSSPASNPPRR